MEGKAGRGERERKRTKTGIDSMTLGR